MNNKYVIIMLAFVIILMSICLIYARQIIQPNDIVVNDIRNTDGTMTFDVRTATYNGAYAPRNAGAIWITNSSNQFIKTIKVWAVPYRYTLVKWIASSQNSTAGAITGASLNSHQLHSVSWNGTNASNNQVPDGDYKINIEFTEHNATTNNPGKYKSITFTKGSNPVDLIPANETYFRDMHLVWEPVPPANGSISGTVTNTLNQPIAGAQITVGDHFGTTNASGIYHLELTPGTYSVQCSAADYIPQTQNNIPVMSSQTTTMNFVLVSSVSNSNNTSTPHQIQINNYPNPFSQTTAIKYYLSKKSAIQLQVYNTKGQLVRTLIEDNKDDGWHVVSWIGDDVNGKKLPSGNYLCRLKSVNSTKTETITIKR